MILFQTNIRQFEAELSMRLRRQVPYAASRALNDTADEAMDAIRTHMQRQFDRPTRWTLNAFRVDRANKAKLSAVIELKDAQKRQHYLRVEARGGIRPMTGVEKLLERRLAYAGIIQTVTPASGARLDRFGNLSRGQRNQILSAIQAQRDSHANTTKRSRARNRRRTQYFVPREGSRLSPGVWARTSKRGSVRKVLHFSAAQASYRKRLFLHERVQRTARARFAAHFRRRMIEAAASAR